MPTEYFEARERALLGQRYETLYAAPSDSAARGVTVSALRATPGTFAAKADMALEPSPFCKAAFVVREETFKPGRHPYHQAGVFVGNVQKGRFVPEHHLFTCLLYTSDAADE